ncbi:MAG: glutaredoxin family protein [Rhodocyclaceae bacterium]
MDAASARTCSPRWRTLRGELGFALAVREVDDDPSWRERYGQRIPVLIVGGEEIRHFFLDSQQLRARLSR